MVIACSALGCTNRQGQRQGLSFYRFPADPERKARWVAAVRRDHWEPSSTSRICSSHFISGSKSNNPLSPDFVPSVFEYERAHRRRRGRSKLHGFNGQQTSKRQRRLTSAAAAAAEALLNLGKKPSEASVDALRTPLCDSDGDTSEHGKKETENCTSSSPQITLSLQGAKATELECQKLRTTDCELRKELEASRTFLEESSFQNNNEKVKVFTGLPTFPVLMTLFSVVRPFLKDTPTMTSFQQYLLTCMKLRMNLTVQFLSYLFGVSTSAASTAFCHVINVMNVRLVPLLLIWPDRKQLTETLPESFRPSFTACTCIVDCFEILIEQPRDLTARAQTYSTGKSRNTIKYLIGIAPQGMVSFISKGWGGRTSDMHIAEQCGILDKLLPGDLVLANRGFAAGNQAGLCCATLQIPAFIKVQDELSPFKLEATDHLASVRTHIERAIGAVHENYRVLQGTVPRPLLENDPSCRLTTLDKMVKVACAMANVCQSSVPFD